MPKTRYSDIRHAMTPGTLVQVSSDGMPAVLLRRVRRTTSHRWYFEGTTDTRVRGQVDWGKSSKVQVLSPTTWAVPYGDGLVLYTIIKEAS